MTEFFIGMFTKYTTPWLTVFIISLMPVLELRGGLIAASILGLPWLPAAAICIIGNILPIPFILFFVRGILGYLKTTRLFGRLAVHYEKKALRGGEKIMEKYPKRIQLALFLFVAVPLPGTGAWTGSLIAAFLGIPSKRSFPPIALGVLGACCAMLALAYAFPALMGF